ncbi:MAG TPA: zinc ribbon domain-containing protein [Gemmatimonadaceae bacterium]|nr:zinc ribbon domain-containing protein [Gemmatimonadaceae bacterium]
MDDLDRLYLLLVHRIGEQYPDHLHTPFEVAELYQSLIPYRHFRRELGIETNGDYELALVRLLSGERGYLQGQSDMQEVMKKELAGNNPNTSIFREYAASRVALPSDAVRRAEHVIARSGGAAGAAPRAAPEARQSAIPVGHNEPATPPLAAAAVPAASAPAAASAAAPSRAPAEPRGTAGASSNRCGYCSGSLPSDRSVTYCPHCGQNLTIRRCPACSTELDLSWKFCITCGRGI